jgi:hypothetical protein
MGMKTVAFGFAMGIFLTLCLVFDYLILKKVSTWRSVVDGKARIGV